MRRDTDIVLLCQYFHPDVAASGVVLSEVAEDLVRSGFAVDCITAQPGYAGHCPALDVAHQGSAPKDETLRGVRVHRLNITRTDRSRLAGRLLNGLSYCVQTWWHVLRANHSATLLINTSPPYLGLIGLAANLTFGQRYVYVVHDIYPDLAVRMGFLDTPLRRVVAACWQWLEKCVLRRASAVIVQGGDMRSVIRAKLPAKALGRVHVIPLCADHAQVRPLDATNSGFRQRWTANGELVALYAGNMGACHDLETIIEAAALLQDEPIRIVLSGDGVKRKRLEALAKARRLTNVIFQDYVPAECLNELLASCDVGLVAVDRLAEGLLVPWKTYNLMAAGKAVVAVASHQSETGRTIEKAKCGVLVEQGRSDELADYLRAMQRDQHGVSVMGAAGRRYLIANLSRQHRAEQFAQVFQAVPEKGSGSILFGTAFAL